MSDDIKVTKCPPGSVPGAGDLQLWSTGRMKWPKQEKRKDPAARWLENHHREVEQLERQERRREKRKWRKKQGQLTKFNQRHI